jgi:hypothetical protein
VQPLVRDSLRSDSYCFCATALIAVLPHAHPQLQRSPAGSTTQSDDVAHDWS